MNILTLLQHDFLPWLCVMSAILGGVMGSFLGVVTERLPAMLGGREGTGNLIHPSSRCSDCSHSLSWWENIPLLSWCLLRGRCRCCHAIIPRQLLMIELVSALYFAGCSVQAPSPAALISLWVLWCGLLPLAVIDARHMLLPDCLTQPLLWTGLVFHSVFSWMPLSDSLYGAVAGYLTLWCIYWAFRLLTKREGLGYGDFKLLAALGAWCGWQALPTVLLASALSAIAVYCLFPRCVNMKGQISFGPFLSLAGLSIFCSQSLGSIF